MKIEKKHIFGKRNINIKHETHKNIWGRFIILVGVLVGYFIFISFRYGPKEGFAIAWLTWSFFVLSTPIADAGFIIDFPVRLLFGLKMYISEIVVWGIAITTAFISFNFFPEVFQKTKILELFYHILSKPIPYWGIIFISGVGTFLSVKFGDELIDVLKHKDREYYKKHLLTWRGIFIVASFTMVIVIYDFLMQKLRVQI